ncbi:copper-binding protein [Pseudomonas sp. PS1]|uniref:Copper-binding protein n=1 Tax=Stutzerimonas marianensis TaxID=2929513 RepID=A0A9X1W9G5_9GAMM|nr:copper-binding protein [Pseudomonas marianensis]MCJ0973748.1 copper-binding protein [Pseudomonas marianensis]
MKPLPCLTLSLLFFAHTALAQDLLKPTAPGGSPSINGGPATEIVSEPVMRATGTVEALDREAGTVTIAHGPVPTLKWPAATMAFQARREQLEGLEVGDSVSFTFQSEGDEAAIVSIETR